jgi:hypothetical protein
MMTPPFRILTYRSFPCLLCLMCNRVSHNPNDVQHHYCSTCGFLDDLPEILCQDNVYWQASGLLLGDAEEDA